VVAHARQAATELKQRISSLDSDSLDLIFRDARTHNGWLDKPVSDEQLHQLYDIMKWGPTSANGSPARIIFVRSDAAKKRLEPALSEGNHDKTMAAPVVAIIGYDVEFWVHFPKLFPHKDMRGPFKDNPKAAETAAFRNGTLQGAYFIIAARALGLDCGPMSGFNSAKVDEEFFAGTAVKSNFLCNLGYGDVSKILQRSPRFDFDEVCKII
jgi:3-hydroxypropanoate dehydrogenase